MNLPFTVGAFLVALGVLIVIHELGHFVVARWCDVKVLRFSVGFGKPLWLRSFGADRTEWALCMLPLGGYVKMLDEREGPVATDELHRAFNRKSVWQRFAIVSAGPIANFALAVLLYWVIFLGGGREARPILAAPEAETPAAVSGIAMQETIRAVDGSAVLTWQEARWRILQGAIEKRVVQLEVSNPRNQLNWRILDFSNFPMDDLEGDPLSRAGLRLYRPEVPPVVGKLAPGDVAEKSGIREGDRILSANGRDMGSWEEFVQVVRIHPGKALTLRLERGGALVEMTLVPQSVEIKANTTSRIGRIGAAAQLSDQALMDLTVVVRYGPVEAMKMAVSRAWETAVFSLKMIGKMLIGEVSWRNLSGPITIADYAGQSAQLGLVPYLSFLALISISLFVLNMLPIPLLDGGHLMYYTIEIFKGSPVSERIMELGQRVGLTLLLFLMAFAFYNDIHRTLVG
jgi:regulator of sigma E protease